MTGQEVEIKQGFIGALSNQGWAAGLSRVLGRHRPDPSFKNRYVECKSVIAYLITDLSVLG